MMNKGEWRIEIGLLMGFVFGFILWIYSFDPDDGLFQKIQLLIIPAAIGVFIVDQRNKWRKIGYYSKKNPQQGEGCVIQKQMKLGGGAIISEKILKKNKIYVRKRTNKYNFKSNSEGKGA